LWNEPLIWECTTKYDASIPCPRKGLTKFVFQTKDASSQALELFELRAEGTLWRQSYEAEDCRDLKTKGLPWLCGCMTRVNKRRHEVRDFIGELRFYTTLGKQHAVKFEFPTSLIKSKLKHLKLITASDTI
jgi:hypothetical protein